MLNTIGKYFTLNRRERNAVLVLIVLLFTLLVVKYLFIHTSSPAKVVIVDLDPIIEKMVGADMSSENVSVTGHTNIRKDSLFYFDPNLINLEQARTLGFDSRCASQLLNYRNKGGQFRKPADLQKLYCMNEQLFRRLSPFIIIHSQTERKKTFSKNKKDPASQVKIEINSADSLQWLSLKGIGPGYSHRILTYRKMLGGFTQITQLKEVYGFTDSLFALIENSLTINSALVQKLKVNTAEFKTLVHHPYIKYEGTKCIFALKRGKKKIVAADLEGSSCFEREHLAKLMPYLDFE